MENAKSNDTTIRLNHNFSIWTFIIVSCPRSYSYTILNTSSILTTRFSTTLYTSYKTHIQEDPKKPQISSQSMLSSNNKKLQLVYNSDITNYPTKSLNSLVLNIHLGNWRQLLLLLLSLNLHNINPLQGNKSKRKN